MAKGQFGKIPDELNFIKKSKPHFFHEECWVILKKIITQISKLCVLHFLSDLEINWCRMVITQELNAIAEFTTFQEILDAESWINEMIDFYIEKAIEFEEYETASNLTNLKNTK